MARYHCPKCGSQFVTSDSHKPNKPNRFKSFESTQDIAYDDPGHDPISHSFWDSYAIRYIITGCFICLVFVVFNWAYDWGLGWIGAILAIVAPLCLHLWTIYKMAPPKPKEKIETIRIETHHKDREGFKHINLDDLDERITISELKGVAKLISNGRGWSRASVMLHAKATDYKSRLITQEMVRLGFIEKRGQKYYVTEDGQAFGKSV